MQDLLETYMDSIINEIELLTEKDYTDTNIDFFGKKLNIRHIYLSGGNQESIPINSKISQMIKIFSTNKALYNYLYKTHINFFKDINSDPYFDGKKINSGNDLIKAIQENNGNNTIDIFYDKRNNIYYICGEYWCDSEHGYSICFPDGKFVQTKSTNYKDWYDNYVPKYTILGQYSDGL